MLLPFYLSCRYYFVLLLVFLVLKIVLVQAQDCNKTVFFFRKPCFQIYEKLVLFLFAYFALFECIPPKTPCLQWFQRSFKQRVLKEKAVNFFQSNERKKPVSPVFGEKEKAKENLVQNPTVQMAKIGPEPNLTTYKYINASGLCPGQPVWGPHQRPPRSHFEAHTSSNNASVCRMEPVE